MKHIILSSVAVALLASLGGCGNSAATADKPAPESTAAEGNHEGWWCAEHGVPEEICAQCDPKLAAKFKADGDWCAKHDRPESQCFMCHPELEAKFAEKYEAKFGKKPPKPES
jgi:predicted small lipoprotein YifL